MYTILVLLDKLLIQGKKDATYPNKTVIQALCGYMLACNYIRGKSMYLYAYFRHHPGRIIGEK